MFGIKKEEENNQWIDRWAGSDLAEKGGLRVQKNPAILILHF